MFTNVMVTMRIVTLREHNYNCPKALQKALSLYNGIADELARKYSIIVNQINNQDIIYLVHI